VQPAETWSDDAWHEDQANRTNHVNEGFWPIQSGEAKGTILGGNLGCLNMLQGTAYFPPLDEAILFLEHSAEGKATLMGLDNALRALSYQSDFRGVRGIVLGRFARNGGVTRQNLAELIGEIPAMAHLPVLANCDFGHTTPVLTVPIGGQCTLQVNENKASITFTIH
jgi:muramoyltetrapeptide carboxypeptidase LdcA involved in peptidoglycan recycling